MTKKINNNLKEEEAKRRREKEKIKAISIEKNRENINHTSHIPNKAYYKIHSPNFLNLPNIPADLLSELLHNNSSPKELLHYYIRQLVKKSQRSHENLCENYYTHNQAASLIFGNGSFQDRMTLMLNNYNDFFIFQGNGTRGKFKPDIEKLEEHHPEIFGIKKKKQKSFKNESFKNEILKALKDEVAAVLNNKNKEYLSLYNISLIGKVNSLNVYQAEIVIEHDDQVVQLPEGTTVTYKNNDFKAYVTILEYNVITNTVTYQTSSNLFIHGYPKLESNAVFLLYNLIKRIEKINDNNVKLKGLFKKSFSQANSVFSVNSTIDYKDLYNSQKEALQSALQKSLTYIWGPPGTGKSYTLSKLLLNLLLLNEKTLVCSIANVAVDGLTKKFISQVNNYSNSNGNNILKSGRVLRIGHIGDAEIRKINELFPHSPEIDKFRESIQILEERIASTEKFSENYPLLLSELDQAKKALANELREKIQNANIILCTSSKAILEDAIAEANFDNLVIDEGSMMAAPQLLGLLKNIGKRVIIAGDFRQLGPIALSSTAMSDKWLKPSLFNLLGSEEEIYKHKSVKMLTSQRRCSEPIIQLINKEFYAGKLETIKTDRQSMFINLKPNNRHIGFIDLDDNPKNICQFSSSHSRYNLFSQTKVMELLGHFLNQTNLKSVGIITPYRAQANQYKKAIENFKRIYYPIFEIKAGTIHSFQGSESDVIIFDMVDSPINDEGQPMSIGNLYFKETGEKLINVAISRAIGKLIIVGCSTFLRNGNKYAQVSPKVKRIIENAKYYSFSGKIQY